MPVPYANAPDVVDTELLTLSNLVRKPIVGTLLAAILLIMPLHSLTQWFSQLEQQNYQQELQRRAHASHQTVLSTFDNLLIQLQALQRHMELSPQISREDFNYFSSNHLSQQIGVASFEWIPALTPTDIPAYERMAHADGLFDFAITRPPLVEAQARLSDPIYPVYYSTSAQMDELSLGADLALSPKLRHAMRQARENSGLALAGQRVVEEGGHERWEIRLFLPVMALTQTHDRGDQLKGFVSTKFYLDDLIELMLGHQLKSRAGLSLVIRNLSDRTSPVLYQSAPLEDRRQQSNDRQLTLGYQFADHRLEFDYIDRQTDGWSPLDGAISWIIIALLLATLVLAATYVFLTRLDRQRRQLEDQHRSLRQAEMDYEKLFHNVIEGLYKADTNGNLLSVNASFAKALGFDSPDAMLAKVTNIGRDLYDQPALYDKFSRSLLGSQKVKNFEWSYTPPQGDTIWFSEHAYLRKDSQPLIYEASLTLITERKLSEQRLNYQATHDPLTDCLNRDAFCLKLTRHLKQCAIGQSRGAIIFLDIDRFKKVNDIYGHATGDRLLINVAQHLKRHLRQQDLVARFGGDEFILYFANVNNAEQAAALASRLQQQIQQPLRLPGASKVNCSASIGICMIESGQDNVEQILQNADVAMYEVKRNGRADQQIFTPLLDRQSNHLKQIEQQLKEALNRREFYLHYQPIVDIHDGRLKGFEALLRWHNPVLGQVSPADFIPVAEETGFISPLGYWILDTALKEFAELRRHAPGQQLFININLSPQQLIDDLLLHALSSTLQHHGLSPGDVHIEVTESAIHHYEEQVIEQLQAFKARGFAIYIDDFGTGHSTLQRLMRYPISGLKIDRSFVQSLGRDRTQQLIVQSLVHMAELLEMPLVAEGVETEEQLAILRQFHCPNAQGYLFSRPLPYNEVLDYITDHFATARRPLSLVTS